MRERGFPCSILFVPAHEQRLVNSAPGKGAEVVLLDLEDSVPVDLKERARSMLPETTKKMANRSQTVWARVNPDPEFAARDLLAACESRVAAIVVPKVQKPEDLQTVDKQIGEFEDATGLSAGTIGLIGLIETPGAMVRIHEVAEATPRLWALAFGSEDFSTACGIFPSPETLSFYCQSLVLAAKAAGLAAIGLPGSIADLRDLTEFERATGHAKAIGFDGVMCIHPRQVELVNRIFAPTAEAIEDAQSIVKAYDDAILDGNGAIAMNGKMIDLPVVERARLMLRRNQRRTSQS